MITIKLSLINGLEKLTVYSPGGKELASYVKGSDFHTIDGQSIPNLGRLPIEQLLDFLDYVENLVADMVVARELQADCVPSFTIQCTQGHIFQKSLLSPKGLKASLRQQKGFVDAMTVHTDNCPECLYECM
jgi:hypothetical protein